MRKITVLVIFIVVLNLLFAGVVSGNINQERIMMRFNIGQNNYVVNDENFSMDTEPVIKEGRTMLPIRFVADALGAEVKWDSGDRKVTVKLHDTEIELWIDNNTARVNGEEQKIDPANPDVKPLIIPPGRTILPLRFISENLGSNVEWCPTREEVTIHYPVNLDGEKKTTFTIEGMEEEVTLYLKVSSLFPYAAYIDQERYYMEKKEGKDFIIPQIEIEPEVFMSIWHREDVSISELLVEIEDNLKEQYDDVNIEGHVEKPLPAYHLYASSMDALYDTVDRYYLVEDFEGGVFIIRQKMFTEAVEGHGARFNGILEEFYIWSAKKNKFLAPGALENNSNNDDVNGNFNTTSCWDYQPTDMAPEPGWENVDLEGLTREELVDVLGCPPYVIRMTSVVSADNNKELWVYHPYEKDSTGLFIWLKGDVFHDSKLDTFLGFWCHDMQNPDFWE